MASLVLPVIRADGTRLVAVPAPESLRHLADITAAMLDQAPRAVPALRDSAEQRLVRTCASAMAEGSVALTESA